MAKTSRLTIQELSECLRDMVHWEEFALHLPEVDQTDINIIKKNNRDDVVDQKLDLYETWLKVFPSASWDDVIQALEKVKENTIASTLRAKFPMAQTAPKQHVVNGQVINTISCVQVSKNVVNELEMLHTDFVALTLEVKGEVKKKVERDQASLGEFVEFVDEQKAFNVELQSVQTTDEFLRAIKPHYNFLDFYLIFSLTLLLSNAIAHRAKQYKEKTEIFMKETKVRDLREKLEKYFQSFCSNVRVQVSISLENSWGTQSVWLVKQLVQHLFCLHHPDQCQWFRVIPGSLLVALSASIHSMTSFIENSKKKKQFMKLMGVFKLQIGDTFVLNEEENYLFSFENSLIQATLYNEIEVVTFLLEQVKVNVNVRTNQPIINATSDDLYETEGQLCEYLQINHSTFTSLIKDIEFELQNAVENGKITAATCSGLSKSFKTTFEFFQLVYAQYSFLNCQVLDSLVPLLSDSLAERAKQYCTTIEVFKKEAKFADLQKYLPDYFPTQSGETVKVILVLESTWHTCSMWLVEQLLQSIFSSSHLSVFQWFRVSTTNESVHAIFTTQESMTILFENSIVKTELMAITGVISLQVGEFLVYQAETSHTYSFNERVAQAKSLGNDEALHLLMQINQLPLAVTQPAQLDDNNNFHVHPDPDSTALMIACCNDNLEMVKLLLNNNADPNIQNGRKSTALIYACRSSKMFQLLLDHNADTNITDPFNGSVLLWACVACNVKVVQILLEKNPELLNIKESRGITELYVASQSGCLPIVQCLLQAHADPNIPNPKGDTPLHIASYYGYQKVVKCLLQAQANPNFQDKSGVTPLHLVCQKGKFDIAELLLLAHADPNIQDNYGQTPLDIAIDNGYSQIVEILLQTITDS